MKADAILEEMWRIKDELSREIAADPAAYRAKLARREKDEEKAGRKIIYSAEELRRHAAKEERRHQAEPMVLREKPPGNP